MATNKGIKSLFLDRHLLVAGLGVLALTLENALKTVSEAYVATKAFRKVVQRAQMADSCFCIRAASFSFPSLKEPE